MGRKVIAILGPLRILAPLDWMLLSIQPPPDIVPVLTFSGLCWLLDLVCRMCLLSLTKVLLHCQKLFLKLTVWIASLPSAFQIIRCLGIWMSILLVNSWGLNHVPKLRRCPKYFKFVMIAFLEDSSRDLCWPQVGLHPQDDQGLLYWALGGLFSQKVFGKI